MYSFADIFLPKLVASDRIFIMRELFGLLAGIIIAVAALVYCRDIIAGRARPARSTRFMYMILMFIALAQQHSLGTRWALVLTGVEAIQCMGIAILSITHGQGGLTRIDQWCYTLLIIDGIFWVYTGNDIVAIHLTILADIIATAPTVVKTLKDPRSETSPYWLCGAVAAGLSIMSEHSFDYSTVVFPVYLLLINAIVWLITIRPAKGTSLSTETLQK